MHSRFWQLLDAASDIQDFCDREGITVGFFGSFADGTCDGNSDLDILIIDGFDPPRRFRVASQIEDIAFSRGVLPDIAFRDLSPHLKKTCRSFHAIREEL
ncbi:hypothetical protein OCH239_10995 [Roseivivax halodurans JCM 10272]|uniref:Polymerase nucleotidyl transferase domain-containing protein n=1 Tax=Roseivivax halodurans JCM 10272 TaxID=1449350 RepID=X7EBP7_9RHOB|nr:nucleotidyltransferase domain-containing protein [Roseivivax halodurans]ETX13362.1 hypothetical protein OCH239_10995 [Roseivivax halodurans JCM 10272]